MKQTLLTLTLMLLPMLASAVAVEIDGIYYNLKTGAKTAEVTKNPNKYSGSVAIPEKVKHEGTEYSVTRIGKEAFYFCTNLTSIGRSTFYECSSLTSFVVPDSVTTIKERTFARCI